MKKFLLIGVVLALIGILVAWIEPPFLETVDRKLRDIHFALRGAIPSSGKVAIVTIDEKSLQEIGRWPWSRKLVGRLFEELVSRGARLVVPDIFFAEPSAGVVGAGSDRAMAEILHKHSNIFMGYYFLLTPQEIEESSLDPETLAQNLLQIRGSALSFVPKPKEIRQALGVQDTLPIFSNLPGGRRHGFFNLLEDEDGTVRETPLLVREGDMVFPSMGLQAALAVSGLPDDRDLALIPMNVQGDFLVNYRGTGSAIPEIPKISACDFLQGRPTPSLEGKIVLVGATATGLEDNHPTPVDPTTPSVVLSAHLIDNLVAGDFLRKDRMTRLISLSLILLFGLVLGLLFPRARPTTSFFIFLTLMIAEAVGIHLFFVRLGWVLQNVYPLASGVLVYGGLSFYGFLAEEKKKRFISETFERYLSSDVIQELTDHPEKVRLGGERKELTVFFSDIRDFSAIVETTPPEVLIEFLNSYLTPVTDIIFRHKGLLDKYIGDAVMAVFGAPLDEPDHPRLACRSAVDIMRLIAASQGKWRSEFKIPRLDIGIGINTGPVTVGNMGSERRFDYTVIGDAVNVASRVEDLNKYYGTSLLVTEGTYEKARDGFVFREIDVVQVKGKKERTRLYELIVDPPYEPDRLIPLFAEGLRLYRSGSFREARRLFGQCLILVPGDGPACLFQERCLQMEKSPLPEGWDGLTVFHHK